MTQSKTTTEDATHSALVLLAEKWLWRQNCGVVFRDRFRAAPATGEQPDAIGWRHNVSILIECKATRSDFLADRAKPFRTNPNMGMGDWRFMLCPKGLVRTDEMLPGWGLLYANGRRVEAVAGMPGNSGWVTMAPFAGNKECELAMFYAALRRMVVRGHFNTIYDPLVSEVSAA